MGNKYLQSEFRRHRTADPAQVRVFVQEWTSYKLLISQQIQSEQPLGRKLDPQTQDALNSQQWGQLNELHKAAKDKEEKQKE